MYSKMPMSNESGCMCVYVNVCACVCVCQCYRRGEDIVASGTIGVYGVEKHYLTTHEYEKISN